MKTRPDLNFLGQDEYIPGGSSSLFLADCLIKITAASKIDESKDFGIKGFYSIAEFLKSRSNVAGIKLELVFEQSTGFDNLLTNINYLKKEKLLLGSGQGGYYTEDYPNEKFKLKTARKYFEENPEAKEHFDTYMAKIYSQFLSEDCEENDEVQLIEKVKDNIWIDIKGDYYVWDEKTDEITPYTGKL